MGTLSLRKNIFCLFNFLLNPYRCIILVMKKHKKNSKKKVFNSLLQSLKSRRDLELKDYGKLLSLRPSKVMKSKKDYKRSWKLEDYDND